MGRTDTAMNMKQLAATAALTGAVGAVFAGFGAGTAGADPKPWEPWPWPNIPNDLGVRGAGGPFAAAG